MSNYTKIKHYCNVIPDYALAFDWAKRKEHFHDVYHQNIDDVLQEIAIACLIAEGDLKKLNNLLGRRIYYIWKWTKLIDKMPGKRAKKYNCKPRKPFFCDICGKEKLEYPRKSFLKDKKICGACYMQIKREDKKRNNEKI